MKMLGFFSKIGVALALLGSCLFPPRAKGEVDWSRQRSMEDMARGGCNGACIGICSTGIDLRSMIDNLICVLCTWD